MKASKIVSLIILVALSGCATGYYTYFWKGNGNAENAMEGCKYQVALHHIPQQQQQPLISECMKSKGFRLYQQYHQ